MYLYTILLCCSLLFPLAQKSQDEQIRVVAVNATPEPETASVVIQLPHANEVMKKNPIWSQVRIEGYALAADSQFDRADEVINSDLGQTLHVIVDNMPYFPINGPSIEPFNEEGFYYDQNYKFELPFKLAEGFHTMRMFLARSFGESLKNSRSFQTVIFYVGKKEDVANPFQGPYLTYNEPSDQMDLVENKPVLLDFLIANCELSQDGYKVKMTIDGSIQRTFYVWKPYYIYGLKKGKHTVRLQLIDEKNKIVSGSFNDVERTIVIH